MINPRRIVVTGARRSGTTLAAAILSSAPEAPPFPGECQLLTRWIESHAWAKAHFEIAGRPFFDSEAEMLRVTRGMLDRFWNHCATRTPGVSALVLKSPEIAPVFGSAVELLSPAQFVVTLRDPRDQIASEWRVLERRRSPRDLRVLERREFMALADAYVRYYTVIVECVAAGTCDPAFVRFEELVSRPRPTIDALAERLEIDLSRFDPSGDWTSLAPSYWSYGTSPSDSPHYGKRIEPARVGAYAEIMSEAEGSAILERCRSVDDQLAALASVKHSPPQGEARADNRVSQGTSAGSRCSGLPAVLGGEPLFASPVPVNRPVLPPRGRFLELMNGALDRARFTNDGPLVRDFEERVAERCGVPHFVATSNGTQALELLARVDKLDGEVIVPAFTFVATAHAFRSAGARVILCDVDLDTMNIDPDSCSGALSASTTAICGVHLWGRAAPVDHLSEVSEAAGIHLYFDAAHAFDCTSSGRPIGGLGRAEVFSFHATKILHTMEGGGIATHCDALAHELRLARNFGFADYDAVARLGTNAKMSEAHAACGLAVLESLDQWIDVATEVHRTYRSRLSAIDGFRLIESDRDERCNHQYVVARVDAGSFGINRDLLVRALHAEGVLARRYFHPGVHRMKPYDSDGELRVALPNTEALTASVLVLPAGGGSSVDEANRVCDAIERLHLHRGSLNAIGEPALGY